MSPGSESSALFLLGLLAALAALASHLGSATPLSAPLAALLAGMLVKHRWPRPWAWQRQLGPVLSLLTMLLFVLVACVTAQAQWSLGVATLVLALLGARLLAQAGGVGLGHVGSGASAGQALWLAGAMTPLSAVALLVASQLVQALPAQAQAIAAIALPAIWLMEMLGALLVSLALQRAGEGGWTWARRQRPQETNAAGGQE
jgi:Kef-type K+ transport system membrane component KefB